MSHVGDGYGSEYHLLRFLGRHRSYLDDRVLDRTGASRVSWLDAPFERRDGGPDASLRGLDFCEDAQLLAQYREFWPGNGSALSWDAVATLHAGDARTWLLVDSTSYLQELRTRCHATGANRTIIHAALGEAKQGMGVAHERDWLDGYFGLTSRLAALWFLHLRGIRAHLLRVHFVGDHAPRRCCPESPEEWKEALDEQDQHVGLPSEHPLREQVHELFLPVCPAALGG